jgi:hypothetical protein
VYQLILQEIVGPGLMLATIPTPFSSICAESIMQCNLPSSDLLSSIKIQFVFNAINTYLHEVNVGRSVILLTSSICMVKAGRYSLTVFASSWRCMWPVLGAYLLLVVISF